MTTRTVWPAAVLAVLAAGCSGKDGKDGTSSGTARGTVAGPSSAPVAGASVRFSPGPFTATTGADGSYAIALPVGVYEVSAERAGFAASAPVQLSVLAGQVTVQDFTLAAQAAEVTAHAGADRFQAGFGQAVELDGSASVAPPGAGYTWQQVAGPPATLSDPSAVRPTFTTLTLPALEAARLFSAPRRLGMVGVSAGEALRLTYVFELRVAAGAATSTARVSIQSIPPQPGLTITPIGALAAVATGLGDSYSWSCAQVSGGAETPCPAGVLGSATGRVATFLPAAPGRYLLRETVGGSVVAVTAASYVGARPVASATIPNCGSCHSAAQTSSTDGRTLTPKLQVWSATPHATFFRRALEGGLPVPYEPSCIRCHTTGFNPEAANGGFDDVAAAAGWTFPTPPASGAWDTLAGLSEQLANLGAVSCESCHGPGSAHAGAGGALSGIVRGFSADTCAQCHAKEPYEAQGLQWINARHATFLTGAVPSGADPALQDGCVACHGARGYVGWIRSGSSAQAAVEPDRTEPQTCVACHDPHGEALDPAGQPTFRQLRVYDEVTTLSGVGARGVGGGATCLKCHNRLEQFSAVTQAVAHFGAEGDIVLGKGAEAFSPPLAAPYPTSAHAAVPRLCVGCHMAPTPPAGAPGHNELGGHSVALTAGGLEHLGACTGCHAGLSRFDRTAYGDYDGDGSVEGVRAETEGLVLLVGAALDARAAALWPAETGGAAQVRSEGGFIRIRRATDRALVFAPGAIPAATADQRDFLRAAWNLFLVQSDRSHGVHNTGYAVAVLQRTYQALTGGPVPGATLR